MKQALSLLFHLLATAVIFYVILALPNPWVGVIALAVILTVSVPIAFWMRRARFMRRLKKLCQERNADLEIQRGWCTRLIVRTEAGTFACVVIPSLLKGIPLLLDDDGKGYRHVWGIRIPSRSGTLLGSTHWTGSRTAVTKAYACYIAPRRKLKFPAGYIKKFVIVNPKPRRVLAGMVQNYVHVDNGERIADYTVYTGGAFCDFVDRQTASYVAKYGSDGW
ncbi:MAG: ABC transporter ATP-binding protein [Clostridia bacterium]|nr:ABC transporter ATP-binding protein [Clostridia bacterium]